MVAVLGNVYGPSSSTTDQSRRKRPAQLAIPTQHQHQPQKRFKASTNSSSEAPSGVGPPSVASGLLPPGAVENKGRAKAEQWFDDANQHPKNPPFVDNDPPYYIQRPSSSDENLPYMARVGGPARQLPNIGPTAPTRSLLAQMDAHNENTDDFRSVIDDLTVQNKKLKRKLKKYERLHSAHLEEEKLFEVRVHGLAAHRKRELEETLRSFASSIEAESPGRNAAAAPKPKAHPTVVTGVDNAYKPSSSSTSLSKPQDSGYASMSGQTGASHSHPLDQTTQDPVPQTKRQNVRSFLHDIPENLAPKPFLAMSERLKTKLVVKRLEQLFTGKGAARNRQGQSQQQQEVSQSAAQADRNLIESNGKRAGQEGSREAHILPVDADLMVDSVEDVNSAAQRGSNEGSRSRGTLGSQHSSSPRSPEQRPTRPLDLDIHRAQVPSDNMEYIRHLGLTSPTDSATVDPNIGDGWVYLNLLTSMAQLHTLNVTSEFIRKAVSQVSAQFELSADETKVRWRGGEEPTRLSSDSGESDEPASWNSSHPSLSASKRGSFAENSSEDKINEHAGIQVPAQDPSSSRRRLVNLQEPSNDVGTFQYKPLFHNAVQAEDSEDSALMSDSLSSSDEQDFTTGINSGSNARQEREAKLRGRRRDDGPIIFYNRAHFCTDLSGDFTGSRNTRASYCRLTEQPVGCLTASDRDKISNADDATSHGRESASTQYQTDKSSRGRSALDLEDLKSSISDCMSIRGPAAAMEASGLGGVRPEDNFVVKVQVRHKGKKKPQPRRLTSFSKPKGPVRKVLHTVSEKSVDAFRDVSGQKTSSPKDVEAEILSTIRTNMAPSRLPPPSYVNLPFMSSDSDPDPDQGDGDDRHNVDAEMSSSSNPLDRYHPSALPRHLQPYPHQTAYQPRPLPAALQRPHPALLRGESNLRYSSSSSEEKTSSGSEESSSIDLLAHAREFQPEFVAAREQEFERNAATVPGSPAPAVPINANAPAPMPVGSSAATAGGDESPVLGATSAVPAKAHKGGDSDEDSDVDSMSVDRNSESSD